MKHVVDKIQAYVSGELVDAEKQLVIEHLAECPTCARETEDARELWAVLGEENVLDNLSSTTAWLANGREVWPLGERHLALERQP